MDKIVYTLTPGNIKPFLDKIQSVGVPDKLSLKVLQSLGFKSRNDRALISIMKGLGFVSSDGTPSDRWRGYRNRDIAKRILAEGIQDCYLELFKIYPDAPVRDIEALTNYFKSHTSVGERAVSAIVQTFKALADNADFSFSDAHPRPERHIASGGSPIPEIVSKRAANQELIININIQLTLPETTNTETYEAIFKAMKKHILD